MAMGVFCNFYSLRSRLQKSHDTATPVALSDFHTEFIFQKLVDLSPQEENAFSPQEENALDSWPQPFHVKQGASKAFNGISTIAGRCSKMVQSN